MSEVTSVPFFTPISYEEWPKSLAETLLEYADDYFYLGGRWACVISDVNDQGSRETSYKEGEPSFLITALKVVSYLTLVLPLIVMIAKALLRHTFHFHLDASSRLDGLDGPEKSKTASEIVAEGISDQAVAAFQALTDKERSETRKYQRAEHVLGDYPNVFFYQIYGKDIDGVFKEAKEVAEEELAEWVKLQQSCLEDKFNLLHIRSAKLVPVVEEYGDNSITEYYIAYEVIKSVYYLNLNYTGLKNSLKQLVAFIVKHGVKDFWGVQLLDTAKEHKGDRRIAIMAIPDEVKEEDRIANASKTIFDEYGSLLLYLQSVEQVEAVVAEAERLGIKDFDGKPISEIKDKRILEIQKAQEMERATQELEQGIDLTEEIKALVQKVIASNFKDVKVLTNAGSSKAIALPEVPGYQFFLPDRFTAPWMVKELYNDMLKAQSGCLKGNYGKLLIPHAKMFTLKIGEDETVVIMQQVVEVDPYVEDKAAMVELSLFAFYNKLAPAKIVMANQKIVLTNLIDKKYISYKMDC